MKRRPYVLLAELTYGCPLHCPYCSNPVSVSAGTELESLEWKRVFHEAARLGVLHVGLSGGEPLLRRDLPELIASAREAGLYTNLITSGLGLDLARAQELRASGLDSVQVSFQADEETPGDAIAGARSHRHKMAAAGGDSHRFCPQDDPPRMGRRMSLPPRCSTAPPGRVLLSRRTGGWHHRLISTGPPGQ